jgi:hypothetical protein
MDTENSQQEGALSSWKDIAKYTGKGVRTVQRWERDLGLPVRRAGRTAHKSSVMAYRSDIDAWMVARFLIHTPLERKRQEIGSCSTTSGSLQQSIQTQQELSEAIQKLSEQIARAAHRLAKQCDPSSSALSMEASWSVTARRKSN